MGKVQEWIDSVTGPATDWLSSINDWFYTWVILIVLVGTGVLLTMLTKGVQFRLFGDMFRHLIRSRGGAQGGISSFQAFAIGMATRIGIGNITGVALAIVLGGPGALFWMWLVAFFGMATAFAEATLAQIFKVRHPDGTFRGGPATYILHGLKSHKLAVAFAVCMIFSMVFAMPMVQSNTIAGVFQNAHGVDTWITAVVCAVLVALVLLGGVRGIAAATEWISPLMAIFYIAIAIIVVAMNASAIPTFFSDVFLSAFGLREALAGTAGGIMAAILNGVRRGLFSNEAGMGTNPNAAATATVSHPVQQGLIQSFGVFLDTVLVCTSTGFIILTSGAADWKTATAEQSAHMTTDAITATLGSWMAIPVSIMIFFFGFSSILGAYAYAEANLVFLKGSKNAEIAMRVVSIATTGLGAILALPFVWTLMDTAMAVITIINLVAVLSLVKWTTAVLRDFERQRKAGAHIPVFDPATAELPGEFRSNAWTSSSPTTVEG